MDKQKIRNIRREIAALIDSIKEHSDNIGNRERIPQLELELILNKIEKLYERSVIFNFLHQQNTAPEPFDVDEEEDEEPVVKEIKPENSPASLQEHQPVSDVIPVEQKVPVARVKDEVKSSVREDAVLKQGINERMSEQEDRSLAARLQNKPVEDLVKAIGINQRFTFIQELFDNNSKIFADSVKHINSLSSLSEAEEFIHHTLVPQLGWDTEEDPTAVEFLQLVRRRFLK